MRDLSGGDLIVRAANKLWRREFCWKDIAKLRFTAFQLRNARSYAEQTLKVQTAAERNGLPWKYRKISYYRQRGKEGELLKRGFLRLILATRGIHIRALQEVLGYKTFGDDEAPFSPCNGTVTERD